MAATGLEWGHTAIPRVFLEFNSMEELEEWVKMVDRGERCTE